MNNENQKEQVDQFLTDNPKVEGWENDDDLDLDSDITKPAVSEEPPSAEPPAGETPASATPPVGEVPVAPPATGTPVAAAAEPPTPVPPTAPDELALLKEQNAKLLEQINELMGKGAAPAAPAAPAGTPPAAAPVVVAPAPGTSHDFIGEEDIDEILSSKDKVNTLLGKVLNVAVQQLGTVMQQSLPGTVREQIITQRNVQTVVDAFYDENKDLAMVKKVVGAVSSQVASEHPDWSLGQILQETAVKVRTSLGLPTPAVPAGTPPAAPAGGAPTPPTRPAALPGAMGGGNRGAVGSATAQQKQINELL